MDADKAGAATHAGEVIALDITSHGVFVYDNGRERRRGAKSTTIYDKNIYIKRRESGFGEKVSL
jgi:hypothetical protein